jgi:hypothetical protein
MAKDKGNKGSQTGSGDKRKGANRADRGTSKASDKPPATKEDDWRRQPGRGISRIEVQVNVPGAEERARKEDEAQKAQEEAQRKAQEEAQKKDPPKKG